MSDIKPSITDAIVEPTVIPPAPTYTKEEVDSAAANARREAESKLSESQKRLDALEAKEKERLELEMTELEKALAEVEEFKSKLEASELSASDSKEKLDAIDAKESEKVEEASKDLTDNQKKIVEALPLYDKMTAIAEFKDVKPPGITGGGKGSGIPGVKSLAEITELKKTNPKLAAEEYKKLRAAQH